MQQLVMCTVLHTLLRIPSRPYFQLPSVFTMTLASKPLSPALWLLLLGCCR